MLIDYLYRTCLCVCVCVCVGGGGCGGGCTEGWMSLHCALPGDE